MLHIALLCLTLGGFPIAQDPFQPLNLEAPQDKLSKADAQRNWVRLTNQRMEMSNKTLRVAIEGFTAIVLAPQVTKPRHAKPILLGKGEHEALFKAIVGMGFTRVVVRNPDTREEWSARLEQGKGVLEN